jgi:hypothetical protein
MKGTTHQSRDANTIDERLLTARAIGYLALLTGILYAFVVGVEGNPSLGLRSLSQGGILLFATLVIGTLGILLGWRWQVAGAATSLLAGGVLAALVYADAQEYRLIATVIYSSPFFVAGMLYLWCWLRRSRA